MQLESRKKMMRQWLVAALASAMALSYAARGDGDDPSMGENRPAFVYVDAQNGSDGSDGNKENPFQTIQHAVDAVATNGIVFVAPGTYRESVVISSRPVKVLSLGVATNTIVEASGSAAFYIQNGASGSAICGFTICDGTGVCMEDDHRYGGGICCLGSAMLTDCIIRNNYSWDVYRGGGMFVSGDGVILNLKNCLVTGNFANHGGVAFVGGNCTLSMEQCTVCGNSASPWFGQPDVGGIMLNDDATFNCNNSILWGNGGYQFGGEYDDLFATVNLSYSCVQDTTGNLSDGSVNIGDGVITDDPYFVDPSNGDFSLQEWSPCRNAASYTDSDGTAGMIGYKYEGSVTQVNPDDFTYKVNDDGNGVTITHVSSTLSGDIVIPMILDGYVVTGVRGRDGIFDNPETVTSVELPQTLRVIGEGAFERCTSLRDITIPDGVQSIELSAFRVCSSLRRIDIPASVSHIGTYGAVWDVPGVFNAYFNVDEGNAWYSSDSVGGLFDKEKKVLIRAPGSSYYESALWSYHLPDTVESVESYAFTDLCPRYGLYITFPASVTNIAFNAFATAVDVLVKIDADNPRYCMVGDRATICNKEKTILYHHWTEYDYQNGHTYRIPSSVTNINTGAFMGCRGLRAVTFSDSVTTVGQAAFLGCSGLSELVLPRNTESFYYATFSLCTGLRRVVVPEGSNVRNFYDIVFQQCTNLTEVVLTEGVREIAGQVFIRCSSLPELVIPESVTRFNGRGNFKTPLPHHSRAKPRDLKKLAETTLHV